MSPAGWSCPRMPGAARAHACTCTRVHTAPARGQGQADLGGGSCCREIDAASGNRRAAPTAAVGTTPGPSRPATLWAPVMEGRSVAQPGCYCCGPYHDRALIYL